MRRLSQIWRVAAESGLSKAVAEAAAAAFHLGAVAYFVAQIVFRAGLRSALAALGIVWVTVLVWRIVTALRRTRNER